MRDESCSMGSEDMHSDMLLKLLVYLLMHRERTLSFQELADALWEEEETGNPVGALKNLMYRLRGILKKHFGEQNFILTARGSYLWNPDIEVLLDTEEFEHYCGSGRQEPKIDRVEENCRRAIALYGGEFVPQVADRHWAVTAAAYYHSLFLSVVKKLAGLCEKKKNYEEMEEVCNYGIRFDEADEMLYCSLIHALIAQNKKKQALEQYENAKKILRDILGVTQSAGLNRIHQEILKMSGEIKATDINSIFRDIREREKPSGVFFCGYPVFREIYRLEARRNARLGEPEYVVLLTLEVRDRIEDGGSKLEAFLLQRAAELMQEVLKESLRVSDIAARNGDRQFVLLLPTCTYEGSMLVADRIIENFHKKDKRNHIRIRTEFKKVVPHGASETEDEEAKKSVV